MIDRNINLVEKKKTALEIIQREGPSLPSAISGRLGLPLLLTSALLSEMRADKSVKLSNLKVGGSPLYFIEGQEAMLDNFTRHLELKEQEAFELLKKEQVINEQNAEPAHRVAFRSMKDFAVPIQVRLENGEKTFWKFHTTGREVVNQKISEILKIREKPKEEIKGDGKESRGHEGEVPYKEEKHEEKQEKHADRKKSARKPKDAEKIKAKISDWIGKKGLVIEKEIDDENSCVVSTTSQVGKLHFLAVANLKKSITEADLSLAFQQGQNVKMPVLLLTNGALTKKAQAYLEQLGKLIVVEKI